jgi:hypothetical protein
MESVFALSNLLVVPFWLTMILAPRWRLTERLQRWPLGVVAPAFIYALLVLPRLPEILPVVARPDLASVAALLATPAGATIAWAHFLAFDLLAGRWIFLDARERGYSAWLISPLLALTLLLGPLGLLGYLLVRADLAKKIRALAGRVAEGSGPLVAVTVGSLGLLAASLILQLADPRQVLGVSAWIKPAKFALSFAITAGTFGVLLRWLQPLGRGGRRAVALIAGLMVLELVIITLQAARAVPSHFNAATPLDSILFGVMGAAILVVWGAMVYLTWRAFRQRFASGGLGWGIRLGLLAMVIGSGLGFIMPRPTAAQLESLAAGRPTPTIGAHAVGVEDGGPGLPVTGWSTEGGDLRIPHFVGMHGLQLLPLLGWLIGRRRHPVRSARLAVVAGLGYLGLTGVLLLQALRGQPLIAPDGWTWLSLAAVGVASLLGGVVVSVRSRAGSASAGVEPARAPAAQLEHPAPQDRAFA